MVTPRFQRAQMFQDILVATDRNDHAEAPIRHGAPRERRFITRLKSVVLELALPTESGHRDRDVGSTIEVQTENATRHAINLARVHGAKLHILFLVDAVRYDTTVEFAARPLREEGEEAVDQLVDVAEAAGLEATGTVAVGRPATLVLEYAAEQNVGLIVLNARGTGSRWDRLRSGLVTTVIGRASVPVYAVPRRLSGPRD